MVRIMRVGFLFVLGLSIIACLSTGRIFHIPKATYIPSEPGLGETTSRRLSTPVAIIGHNGEQSSAPTISNLPDLEIDEDSVQENVVDLWNFISTENTPREELTFTAISDDSSCGLIINANHFLDFHTETNWYGECNITVQVTDSLGRSSKDAFRVRVNNINDAPFIDKIPDLIANEDTPLAKVVKLWRYVTDETPDDELLYSINSIDNPSCGVSIASNRYIDIIPLSNWNGSCEVIIQVADPEGAINTSSFRVNVISINDEPSITNLPNMELDEDTRLEKEIDLWSYTIDVETIPSQLNIMVSSVSNPSCGVSINGNRYLDIFPVANWFGDCLITIQVFDPEGDSATDDITVLIKPVNDIPWIFPEVPGTIVELNKRVTIDLTDYEHDMEQIGAELDWYVTGENNCVVLNEYSDDDVLTFIPDNDFAGVDYLILHLIDVQGGESTEPFWILWGPLQFFLPMIIR